MKTKTEISENGVPFNARLILKGETYGLNDVLTHDKPEPLIEFYDARYMHTKFGQFVSRYYLSTIADVVAKGQRLAARRWRAGMASG